ncbi:MAG: DUF1097 domain-containing protein [Microbacteriaceae bacterium]|nr:DUF1097 domain-containing protein [Microbacteriaceae bacterium]
MKPYTAVGITIGVLAGIWTQVSISLGLITWVAFAAWACFYAAGAKRTGFLKTLPSNLSGVAYGWLIVWAAGAMGGWPGALAVCVAVGAFLMCIQANWSVLSFIPGAFVGTAAFFGTSGNWSGTVIALVAGVSLAWLSGWTADLLVRATTKPTITTSVAATSEDKHSHSTRTELDGSLRKAQI